jgi:hypothetical protein
MGKLETPKKTLRNHSLESCVWFYLKKKKKNKKNSTRKKKKIIY